MISQELVDLAKKNQQKTWDQFRDGLTFFKKTEVPFDAVFSLENWTTYQHYPVLHIAAKDDGYPWIAKHWASSYIDYHVYYMWNVDYKIAIEDGLDVKKATVQADKLMADRLKAFKSLYP